MGTYSGGRWIAIAEWNREGRLAKIDDEGNGGDVEARDFWYEPPKWVSVGESPQEALNKLMATRSTDGDSK